jgi:hypothetical protein
MRLTLAKCLKHFLGFYNLGLHFGLFAMATKSHQMSDRQVADFGFSTTGITSKIHKSVGARKRWTFWLPQYNVLITASASHVEIDSVDKVKQMWIQQGACTRRIFVGGYVFQAGLVVVDGEVFEGIHYNQMSRSDVCINLERLIPRADA